MKQFTKVLFFMVLFSFISPLLSDDSRDPQVINYHPSSERMLCTTITQGQYVRFNRCRNGEVMTGIRGFDPLTVYCTTLLANCRTPNLKHEQE